MWNFLPCFLPLLTSTEKGGEKSESARKPGKGMERGEAEEDFSRDLLLSSSSPGLLRSKLRREDRLRRPEAEGSLAGKKEEEKDKGREEEEAKKEEEDVRVKKREEAVAAFEEKQEKREKRRRKQSLGEGPSFPRRGKRRFEVYVHLDIVKRRGKKEREFTVER